MRWSGELMVRIGARWAVSWTGDRVRIRQICGGASGTTAFSSVALEERLTDTVEAGNAMRRFGEEDTSFSVLLM